MERVKGIKTTRTPLGKKGFRYRGFKNKSKAQEFAKIIRIENKKLQPILNDIDDVSVRVFKDKEGWVVDEIENPRFTVGKSRITSKVKAVKTKMISKRKRYRTS